MKKHTYKECVVLGIDLRTETEFLIKRGIIVSTNSLGAQVVTIDNITKRPDGPEMAWKEFAEWFPWRSRNGKFKIQIVK